jgi:pilus assembly protein Flp/PilA
MLQNNKRGNSAAGLAEYGMLIALIAVVCLGAVALLGNKISGAFNAVAGAI